MANNLKDIYTGVNKCDENRNENDLYRTPPLATYILHKYSNIPQKIVEPCAGFGNISVELKRCGYDVLSYDLNDYGDNKITNITTGVDALQLERPEGYTGLVTNPPYHKNIPHKLAEKATSEYDYVAFLLRLTFLEGIKRKTFFDICPPTQILFFSDRIKFSGTTRNLINRTEQVGGMIAYAWFIFEKNSKHENTKISWVSLNEEYDEWRLHYESSNAVFDE